MGEVDRLEGELGRAHEGRAWHGPSLSELLKDVSAEQAVGKPCTGAHSIWELVLHITAWERTAVQGLEGKSIDLPQEMDWPPVAERSEAAWKEALQGLEEANRTLRAALSKSDDSRLEEGVEGRDYSQSVLLHGVLQHTLYHAGQIALLKKM